MTMAPTQKRKRPVAVTVVGIVGVFFAVMSLGLAIYDLWWNGVWMAAQQGVLVEGTALTPLGQEFAAALYDLLSGLVTVFILWGFLRVRPWAWIALMVWVGIGLAIQVARYFYDDPNYPRMLLSVVVAFALNQAEVQEAFGIHRRDDGELEQLA